ncbi:MAG TPA: carbon-nitrogen hydrolase family protein, partial [Dehalococcoidia bacterium]|nr:carbon-nitrogen hydrolase family protein [Dehalococcoidia bacterium]
MPSQPPFTVAAVQAAPVFLDREATLDKACRLIAEAAAAGARLIVFPESFVPAYPDWVWAVPPGDQATLNELYAELLDNAVEVPSPATDRLCRAAKDAGAYVVMGVTERNTEASGGSLYNTLLYIDPRGRVLGKHRKLVPTGAERLVWAQGDGSTLAVYDTPLGKLGGLICWENYMPLARYAMYAWGTQIYVAATWDRGEPWLSTLRHIAKEGRVYVIGCCIAQRLDGIPDRFEFKHRYYPPDREWINVGDSAIVDPDGEFIAGPVRLKEEVLYAEL